MIEEKRMLITGAGSYIGVSVENWLKRCEPDYHVDTLDMLGNEWKNYPFNSYDVIFHVAGIAHIDVGRLSEKEKDLYNEVNNELAVAVARKAKEEGVKQFIFMSSISIYEGCKERNITIDTQPDPQNCYGESKWQADQTIRGLENEVFKVVIIRPPMIYGKNSKGNYPKLAKIAEITPIFPKVKSQRSMLYIDNLCEFIRQVIKNEESGIFFPQNQEYVNVSEMVKLIAREHNHVLLLIPGFAWLIKLLEGMPGKIGNLTSKAFKTLTYDMELSNYKFDYRVKTLQESIVETESQG